MINELKRIWRQLSGKRISRRDYLQVALNELDKCGKSPKTPKDLFKVSKLVELMYDYGVGEIKLRKVMREYHD